MKIAIIGAGNVGSVLGKRWAQNGHEIYFGMREPQTEKAKAVLKQAGANARATSVREAIAAAPVVVLATPWHATQTAIAAAGDLSGKIVVDCTNPLKADFSGLEIGHTISAAEQIAQWAQGAKVVKAFNTTGSKNMENPLFGFDRVSMFICGDDADAKQVVMDLAAELDFEAVDCGMLFAARYLEPLAMLWIYMAFGLGRGVDFAFKILQR